MKIKSNSIAAKVQETVDDLNGEIEELIGGRDELKVLLTKVLKAKGFQDIPFAPNETSIIDKLIGVQSWNGQ